MQGCGVSCQCCRPGGTCGGSGTATLLPVCRLWGHASLSNPLLQLADLRGARPASPAQRAEPQPGRSPCPPETIRGGGRMQSEGSEVGLSLGLASFLKVAGFSHSSRCPGAPVLSLCCWCWRHSDFLLVLRSPTLLPLSPFGPAYKPGHCFLSPFFLTTSSQQNPTAINTYP